MNFAIVGYGGIAKTHLLAAYDANINFSLDYSINPAATLTRSPNEHKISSIKNYQDFSDMVSSESLDFIDICTPNNAHLNYIAKAAARGLSVYCEKPVAQDLATAKEAAHMAEQSGIINGCALVYRMLPAVNMIKAMVKSGMIGKVITFKTALFHSGYLSSKKSGWRVLPENGGGAMLDLGIHLVDTVRYILGDIADIQSKTHIQFPDRSKVDEHAFCHVTLASGIEGTIEVSRILAQSYNSDIFEVYGEKGSITADMKAPHTVNVCDFEKGSTTIVSAGENMLNRLHYPSQRDCKGFLQSAHTAALIEFCQSINCGRRSDILADLAQGVKAQEIVERVYR